MTEKNSEKEAKFPKKELDKDVDSSANKDNTVKTRKERVKEKVKEQFEADTAQLKKHLHTVSPARWVFLILMSTITVLGYVFYGQLFGEGNWFKNPDTGVLFFDKVIGIVPTLVKCIQSVTILLLLTTVAVVIVHKSFSKTPRGLTISSLICNLINWVTAIIIIIIILSAFGVDTTALITGAGVVTLIVGLGMQSLIADIVAGLFIVFENEFNVGDWVTVDGYRGEVVSIGIRTTKLKAAGNVKIINNSDLRGVINHDADASVAKTLIDVEYDAKLPEVEKLIKKNVAKLKVEHATDEVSYDGVASLGASGVTLQFTCHCKEADMFAAGRELNAAVKNMFDENNIGIPFPQIVVRKG